MRPRVVARCRRVAAAAMAVLLPVELAGCAQSPGTTFDYAELAADARTACTVLSAEADALVAAGRLDPVRTEAAEAAARLAVAALAAPLSAPRPVAGGAVSERVGAFDLAGLQALARQARMALAALAALIPPGVLPGPVAVAIQIADALLDAFVAVTPLQARVTLVAGR